MSSYTGDDQEFGIYFSTIDIGSFWEGDCDNLIYVSKYYSGHCIVNELFKGRNKKQGDS